jgi:hypothetical protein
MDRGRNCVRSRARGRRRLGNSARRGLAPLELVLAIPLLLFVLALSVIFGTVTCWKIRGETAARDAIWGHRWPRGEPPGWDRDPRAREWPLPATFSHYGGGRLTALDHGAFRHPVIRGPLPSGLAVDDRVFDPTLGLRIGQAGIDRAPPMLGTLGNYRFDVEQPLFDNKWQHGQMGLANTSRRIPVIYPNLLDPPQTAALRAQYQQAVNDVVSFPLRLDLAVLDRDDEFLAWYGGSPDFHPRFPRFCGLDPAPIFNTQLPAHIERIDGQPQPGRPPSGSPRGVPADMTRAFLRMYRHQLWVLQNSMPPGPPAQIADLQNKIAILEAFLMRLP